MKTSDPRVKMFRDSFHMRNHVSAMRAIGSVELQELRERNWEALYKANRDQSIDILARLHSAYWKGMREADIVAAENPDQAWCDSTIRELELRKMVLDWKQRRNAATGSARWYYEDNSRFERAKVFGLIALLVLLAWAGIIWRLAH